MSEPINAEIQIEGVTSMSTQIHISDIKHAKLIGRDAAGQEVPIPGPFGWSATPANSLTIFSPATQETDIQGTVMGSVVLSAYGYIGGNPLTAALEVQVIGDPVSAEIAMQS